MSYTTETNGTTGWGVGLSAIIGGALGYWAGRSSYPGCGNGFFGGYNGCGQAIPVNACAVNGCTTCYQQGIEAGQTLAGIDYAAQMASANANNLRNYVS